MKKKKRKGEKDMISYFNFSIGISIIYKPRKYQTLNDLCLNEYMERQLN